MAKDISNELAPEPGLAVSGLPVLNGVPVFTGSGTDAPTGLDFTSEITGLADIDGQRKAYLTLQARFAIGGFELQQQADGTLLATWPFHRRVLPDLAEAMRFLAQEAGAAS